MDEYAIRKVACVRQLQYHIRHGKQHFLLGSLLLRTRLSSLPETGPTAHCPS